jgi:hypothetical protein
MPNTDTPLPPSEVFLHFIVSFLAPMFLTTTGGDPATARLAAIQTVNAYGARTLADLLPIAQVIAFGLAVLDSLSRSMEESLPTTLVLRLRGNAASLNRGAEQCRRALHAPPLGDAEPSGPGLDPEQERQHEAAALASLVHAERQLAERNARPQTSDTPEPPSAAANSPAAPPPSPRSAAPACTIPEPPPGPAESSASRPTPDLAPPHPVPPHPAAVEKPPRSTPPTEDQYRAAWAAGMTEVAREYATGLANLPPAERRDATMRATILSTVARELLSGEPMSSAPADFPPWSAPPRRFPQP